MAIRLMTEPVPSLQDRVWPPVDVYRGLSSGLQAFLGFDPSTQAALLMERRGHDDHDRDVHEWLAEIYAYVLGYQDSPCHLVPDDRLEIELHQAKIVLERELLEACLALAPPPLITGQGEVGPYLRELICQNPGFRHPLFDFLADAASREELLRFLHCEVIRNEVVDDEVAALVIGLQGWLKVSVASNLWDECGRGRLQHFHTYWLRRLLNATDSWDEIVRFRAQEFPWFARITSNTFMTLLTRPSYKLMAFGCFLVFESWVAYHFQRILQGMQRVGLSQDDITVYFTAHVSIDPRHTSELLDGIGNQIPRLTSHEVRLVVQGAQLAVAAGKAQYDRMLPYLAHH